MTDLNLPMKLYNSMSRRKEIFQPQNPSNITIYACGPTVWDTPHIGNARPAVVFDVLYRILRHMYGQNAIKYARNFTDIDDKIIKAAKDKNVMISQITKNAEITYLDNMDQLEILEPTFMPRATEHIDSMIKMIEILIDKGYAYISDKNEVLFHVPSSKHKSLAKHSDDGLDPGARVEVDPSKKDPRDFVLWKPSKSNEPKFDSPFGKGRPGWHIECSAMIATLLGETIDIHAGGQDLRFPHHEAEITQSYACHDKLLANYWLHNGMLTVNGAKMAKSQGNFVTVDEALEKFPGETIRFFLLKTHYRRPLDWTWEGLDKAQDELDSLYRKLRETAHIQVDSAVSVQVLVALLDDLNTPKAITALHREAKEKEMSVLKSSAHLLGLLQEEPDEWFTHGLDVSIKIIEEMVDERNEARKEKDFKKADKIREQLLRMSIILEDKKDKTLWRRKYG